MVETKTVKLRLPTGGTKTVRIIRKVNLKGNSYKPQNLADKLLGKFTHYEVNVEDTDSLNKPILRHDYLPREWIEKGRYS